MSKSETKEKEKKNSTSNMELLVSKPEKKHVQLKSRSDFFKLQFLGELG